MGINTVITLFFLISAASAFSVGGIGAEKDANPEVQSYIDAYSAKIKQDAWALLATGVSKPATKSFANATLKAISYKTQMVSGTNYFVKTKIDEYTFCVRLYKDITGKMSLTKVVGPKAEDDAIGYF